MGPGLSAAPVYDDFGQQDEHRALMEQHGEGELFSNEVSLFCFCDTVIAHWILDFGRRDSWSFELHLELTESSGRMGAVYELKLGS